MNRRCMGCMEEYDEQFEVCPFCGYIHGTPPKEAYHIKPGSLLEDRYVIGKVLGFGGFGITYIGFDQVLQTKVAIKEYMPGEFSTRMPDQQTVTVYSGEREEQFREGMAKIVDEAKRLAKFQDEPNIVHIYDCFEANNTAYIIMEYLDGESVKELLEKEGKLSVERALDIVLKVISPMKKVHKEGIIHRDIAPDNIYVLKNGDIKVLDFGAARYATTKYSKSLSVLVKPGYAPEEQYRSHGDQGPWTDVYALAATFYRMITGIVPEDAMERNVKDSLKKPSKLGASLPKGMETAIMNALNVRIEDRTQSMEEFEKELLAAEVKEKIAKQRKADVGKIPLWAKIAAGVGAVGLAVAAVYVSVLDIGPKFGEYNLPEGKTLVPNMINQDQQTAFEMGEKNQIKVTIDHMLYSSVTPEGLVTNQSIEGGKQVDTGTEVLVEISRGREKVAVPLVEGLSEKEAREKLEKAELSVEVKTVKDEFVAPGSVVSQSIEGNTTAVKGDTIFLEIAEDDGKGDSSVLVSVPELTGMDYKEARIKLRQDYLYLSPSYEYSDTVPEGIIISSDTPAGEKAPQKSTLSVVVSMGIEKLQMPGFEYTDYVVAVKKLEDMGFIVTVEEEYSANVEAGRVIRQSIAADEMAEKGSAITLTVSTDKKPEQPTRGSQPRSTKGRERQETQAPPPTQLPPNETEGGGNAAPQDTTLPGPGGPMPGETGGDLDGLWRYVPN